MFYNWIEWVLGGFGAVSLIKNLAKVILEFLPAAIEMSFGHAYEKSAMYLSLPASQRPLGNSILAHVGSLFGLPGYYLFRAMRELTMRITSPFRSLNQAHQFGIEMGLTLFPFAPKWSRATAYLCTAISAALTVTAMTTVAIMLAPVAAISLAIKFSALFIFAVLPARLISKEIGKKITTWYGKKSAVDLPPVAKLLPVQHSIHSRLGIAHLENIEIKQESAVQAAQNTVIAVPAPSKPTHYRRTSRNHAAGTRHNAS